MKVVVATVLATGALAAPASAAVELDPLKRCYVSANEESREGIEVRGTGFTPLAMVDVLIDGVVVASGPADTVGDVIATVPAAYQKRGQRAMTVTVAEQGNPANAVSAETRVTALYARMRPEEAATDEKVRLSVRGFTSDRKVYAHYVHGGEVRKTVRLVRRARGACGTFRVRRRQIPIRNPSTGRWIVQIDQQRRYEADPETTWLRLPIQVRRVFRAP